MPLLEPALTSRAHRDDRRRPFRPALTMLSVLVALLITGVALVYLVAVRPASAEMPPADVPTANNPTERRLQDLQYLRRLPEVDPSFSLLERRRFEDEIDGLIANASGLDDGAFEMSVTRAVAIADNGHTYVRGVAMGRSLNSIPLHLVWFADGLHVVAAKAGHHDLLGARVLALNGRTPEALAIALGPYVGGRDTRGRLFSVNFMSSPQALQAAGLATSPSEVAFIFETLGGERVERVIQAEAQPAVTEADEVRWPAMDRLPGRLAGAQGWRHVLQGSELPLHLQQPQRWFWRTKTAPDTLYVALRRTRNQPDAKLSPFLAETLQELERTRPRYLIVDMRADTGGSYELASDFAKRAPSLLDEQGRLFVLVGPDTFSAGIVTVAQLKHAGGPRTVVVGEPLGDDPVFWAEGGRITLPNSKLVVRYATAMHNWRDGCGVRDIGRCYWLNYLGGVGAGDLDPGVSAPFTFQAYRSARDPAMEAVERLKASLGRRADAAAHARARDAGAEPRLAESA